MPSRPPTPSAPLRSPPPALATTAPAPSAVVDDAQTLRDQIDQLTRRAEKAEQQLQVLQTQRTPPLANEQPPSSSRRDEASQTVLTASEADLELWRHLSAYIAHSAAVCVALGERLGARRDTRGSPIMNGHENLPDVRTVSIKYNAWSLFVITNGLLGY